MTDLNETADAVVYVLGPRSPTVAQANEQICDWIERHKVHDHITSEGIKWAMHQLTSCGYPTLRARADQVEIFMRWGVLL